MERLTTLQTSDKDASHKLAEPDKHAPKLKACAQASYGGCLLLL